MSGERIAGRHGRGVGARRVRRRRPRRRASRATSSRSPGSRPHAIRADQGSSCTTTRDDARATSARCRRSPPASQSEDGQEGVAAFLEKREAQLDRTVKAVVLHEVGGDARARGRGRSRRARVVDVRAAGHQLRRRPDPARPLPADAGAAVRARQRGRRRARRPARDRAAARAPAATRSASRSIPQWTFAAARRRVVRRRRVVPDDLPHGVHPAAPAGARRRRRRRCSCTPGSGGVGCAAIQLAKQLGATVIATASSDEKRAFAREVGADEARRLRRDRRPPRRRRRRPGRRRDLHPLAAAAQPARGDRRGRLRGRAVDRSERAVARRAQRRPSSASTSAG